MTSELNSFGTATAIIGCMWAGKTTELMRIAGVTAVVPKAGKIIRVKPLLDDQRWSDGSEARSNDAPKGGTLRKSELRTHSGRTVDCYTVTLLDDLYGRPEFVTAKNIFLDEGQFFPNLRDFVLFCICNEKNVFFSALNGDFEQKAFPSVANTLPLCAEVVTLHGVCMECYVAPSSFTILREETPRPDGQVLVGGEDEFVAVCPSCLIRLKHSPSTSALIAEPEKLHVISRSPSPDFPPSLATSPPREPLVVPMNGIGKGDGVPRRPVPLPRSPLRGEIRVLSFGGDL